MYRIFAAVVLSLVVGCTGGSDDRQGESAPRGAAETGSQSEPSAEQHTARTQEPATGAAMTIPESPTPVAEDQFTTAASGLKYYDLIVGQGQSPQEGQTVTVQYAGWLTDGTRFDTSYDKGKPFSFPLGVGRVIPGWDEGVLGMKEGGKRQLVIPAHLGYGARGAGGVIPPDATLIFEVELLGMK